jgi:hypothetical protein
LALRKTILAGMRHDQHPAGKIFLLSFEAIRKAGSQKPVLGLKRKP